MRLSFDDLKKIESLLVQGLNAPAIAQQIGCNCQSIYDEIKRGSKNGVYSAEYSMSLREAAKKQIGTRNKHKGIFEKNKNFAQAVSDMILNKHMSPEEIDLWLQTEENISFPRASRNTIYKAIDSGQIPGVTREIMKSHVKMFSGGHIIVPVWIREAFEYKDGTNFLVSADEKGNIFITPE